MLQVYDRRLKCHMQCAEKTETAKTTCEALYCDGFDAEAFEFEEDLDDLMYDLDARVGAFEGLTDEDVKEVIDKARKEQNEVNQ